VEAKISFFEEALDTSCPFSTSCNISSINGPVAAISGSESKDILILEDLNYDAPKTKEFISLMSSLKLQDDKILLVLGTQNDQVYKSARNLKKVKVVTADTLNTFDLLNAKKVVLSESSLEKIENILN